MKLIDTAFAPLPGGHYSQAVRSGHQVFVSGQLPFLPGAQRTMPDGIDAQARQVFANVEQVLRASGASLAHLLNVQIFIADIALWDGVDRIYREVMGAHKPARSVIPCGPLHHGALLEVNAVALVPASSER